MVSLCALQFEIAEDSHGLSDDLAFNCARSIDDIFENVSLTTPLPPRPERTQEIRDKNKGNRNLSDIVIETYTDFKEPKMSSSSSRSSRKGSKEASPLAAASADNSSTASSSKRSTKDNTPIDGATSSSDGTISFSSGNPFVEVTKGILHFYKENSVTSLEEGVLRSQMICKIEHNNESKNLTMT